MVKLDICQVVELTSRHLERMPVILSEAKDLARRTQRSFASLRMTGRTAFKSAHGKSSLQMSGEPLLWSPSPFIKRAYDTLPDICRLEFLFFVVFTLICS